jgi:hypothetical protein
MNDAQEIRLHELDADNGVKIIYFADKMVNNGSVIVMLSPSTWAFACSQTWEIAEDILHSIGTSGVDSIFETTNLALETYITELIAGIRDVVKQHIDDEQMQLFIADVHSFLRLIREYNASPQDNLTTLKMVADNTVFPVGRLEALERNFPVAAQAYLAAALLRLTALQEYALRSHDAKDFKAFTDFAAYAAKTGRAAVNVLPGINDERVTAIDFQRSAGGCQSIGEKRECWWFHRFVYTVDGVRRERSRHSTDGGSTDAQLKKSLEEERNLDLTRVRAELKVNVLNPLNHTIKLLEDISALKFTRS